jgi:type IV pilus assembly protein PilV
MAKNNGFTLVEVLVALVVLAGGLLGLAALQATSLRNTQSAYNRSQATQLAYQMADRMRANVANAGLLATSAYVGAVPGAAIANCTAAAGCTPAQMAQNDLFEWNQDIDNALSANATGTIAAVPVGAPTGFTITINWDDDRLNGVDANDPNFQMSFRL